MKKDHTIIEENNVKDIYSIFIANNADFRVFVENMEKYSTDEIINLYGLKNAIVGCLFSND